MNVELVNTGSELLLGRILNTHQQWLCRRLADLGHVVTRQVAVADSGAEIQAAVREALNRADLVITTGGLGPTSDDITRELVAEVLGRKLVQKPEILAHIENYFAKRNRPRPSRTMVETFVPEGALVFLNANGTAPGLAMKIEDGKEPCPPPPAHNPQSASAKWLVMLPGPPRELRPMFDEHVVPLLQREFVAEVFVCRTLRSTGIGESRVQEAIESSLQPLVEQGLQVGYCARPGAVDVRLSSGGAGAAQQVRDGEAIVQRILGAHIFGFDDDEMETVVVRLLTQKKKTLALAESCTGGGIAHRVTNVPGASEIFLGGVVSYANSAKEKFLGVRAGNLAAARRGERGHGAGNGRRCAGRIRLGFRAGGDGHRRSGRRHGGETGGHGVRRAGGGGRRGSGSPFESVGPGDVQRRDGHASFGTITQTTDLRQKPWSETAS